MKALRRPIRASLKTQERRAVQRREDALSRLLGEALKAQNNAWAFMEMLGLSALPDALPNAHIIRDAAYLLHRSKKAN